MSMIPLKLPLVQRINATTLDVLGLAPRAINVSSIDLIELINLTCILSVFEHVKEFEHEINISGTSPVTTQRKKSKRKVGLK